MEVFKMLPEGTHAEVIDNQIYMSPSPVFNHQDVLLEIASQLKTILKGRGTVVIAPFDIYLDETKNVVQPDIAVVLSSNPKTLHAKSHYHGVPDIVVEILSPGNMEYDLIKKKELYQRFRISEYWIVNPESKTVVVYVPGADGQYTGHHSSVGKISSPVVHTTIIF